MKTVSIIVPLYHGEQYIENLIEQAEKCVDMLSGNANIELLLVSDDPDCERINFDGYNCNSLMVKFVETDVNRGIHATRVRGLSLASGEYVVFLDQDDYLYPRYIQSQLEKIANDDAIVCRYLNEGRQYYDVNRVFEDMISKEYITGKGNPIVSMGAVMIRKSSIPDVWKKNIIKNNGADDYFLWLCMALKECKFGLNQDILFARSVNGGNTSFNSNSMLASVREMFDILVDSELLGDEEASILETYIEKKTISTSDKLRKMFFYLNRMVEVSKDSLELPFSSKDNTRIGIYGAGYLGKRFCDLWNLNKNKVCFIDKNAEYLNEEDNVVLPENIPNDVRSVVITVIGNADLIMNDLQMTYSDKKFYLLEEFLFK